MPVPEFQTFMLPVLRFASTGPRPISEAEGPVAEALGLGADDLAVMIPSGRKSRFWDRLQWAATYLAQAGLIERPQRGFVAITADGRAVLDARPERIDRVYLSRFPKFLVFQERSRSETTAEAEENMSAPVASQVSDATPDEIIRAAHAEITDALAVDLLDRIRLSPPKFFEELIVDLLVRMGYGSGGDTARAIGQTGDDGVDGVINLDALGVDQVYFQAKRYQTGSPVSAGALRDFFGALAMKDVTKGIFVTTSHFTASARDTAEKLSKRIVLIDGATLARLMIRHSVGCRVTKTFPVSTIDESYFA